ncbi:MAG: L,D-transpeptidase, partial [Verrucomicrobiota bacterium]
WGGNRRYDGDGDGIPDVWVFNDFGPVAINYFRDPNRNRRRDEGETIMGEMIHTTPQDEGLTDQGKAVTLSPSHGCIHVRPADLARLLGRGAVRVGELLVVHGPNEVVWEELKH